MRRWRKRRGPDRAELEGSSGDSTSKGRKPAGPAFVPRERVRFVHGERPLLVIAAGADTEVLPALRLEGGLPARCEGWTLVAQLTVCVVDGPGDAGFLIQAAADLTEAEEQNAWLLLVEAAGGAVVAATQELGTRTLDEAAARSDARGGFVPLGLPG